MTDVPPGSRPAPPPGPEGEPEPTRTHVLPPDRDPSAGKPRFADRVWSLPAVIAIALASVILGGLGGAALASAGDDDDRGRRFQRGDELPPGMERFLERRQEFLERRGFDRRNWPPPKDFYTPRPPRPTPSS